MLRDFAYSSSHELIRDALRGFGIDEARNLVVVRFEVISPDSFVWRLSFGEAGDEAVYYLYAEDYVPSLDYIIGTFQKYIEDDGFELARAVSPVAFEDSSPVRSASYVKPPRAGRDFMIYRIDSGYDHVFLAKSCEKSDDALFSRHAPRGFKG